MSTQVIVLNGGSSSGKTGIARCLQAIAPRPWLLVGVDAFVDTLPPSMTASTAGITFAEDGAVVVGDGFRTLETAWNAGVAHMARCGAHVIVDDVFLSGAASQRRWRTALAGLAVLWVGVRCDPEIAAGRELSRGDRTPGMAAKQATIVHDGVDYDLEVDSGGAESIVCARAIAAALD